MNQTEIMISVEGQACIIPDATVAFGNMPEHLRIQLIETTADDIVTQQYLDSLKPLIVSSDPEAVERALAGRHRGLEALGVADVDAEIDKATKRFMELDVGEQAKRAVQFMR